MTRPGTKYRHYRIRKQSAPDRCRNASPESQSTASLPSQPQSLETVLEDPNREQPEGAESPNFGPISPKTSPGTDSGSTAPPEPGSSRLTLVKCHFRSLHTSYSQYQKLILNYLDRSRSFVIPRPLILDLLLTLPDVMKEEETNLYARLTQNACRPIPIITVNLSVEEFCEWFKGTNLRWEFIGVVFALAGLASIHTETEKPFSKESFAADMYAASRACIEICEENNQMNDMTIWLRHTNVALASNLFGDTSNVLYRCFSSLTTELFSLGYHRQISSQAGVPFFMSETRKRIFAAAVCRDMNLSTLLERPPFIDCDFCDMAFPVDLDEEEIVLVGSELDAALRKLDENGWKISTEREKLLRPATGLRLRYLLSNFRAKVLRLSLGNRTECMTQKYLELYQEYEDICTKVPLQYRYESNLWNYMSPQSCVVLLSIHLDHLHCGFQIERMLQQEGQNTISMALDTSMKLLSGMLDLMKQQERFVELRERFAWIFLFYGLPGAGTLATELHQHILKGIPLPSSVSCSRIIRDLSVAISWIENQKFTSCADYQLCLQISKVISRLLDDTLNHGLASSQDTATQVDTVQREQYTAGVLNIEGSLDSLDKFPPLSEPVTSEEFLSWVDDLVWDGQTNINMGF
ncbi:hypothetical protein BDV23DRAFT_146898 [Aspergillus alliaceus]|uniref:Xylanolytic transcriptional activator regulatory domain-containing protein n=1 Tax=Petromyces alliaceus TaxID=209559 RepID=A0A5N7CKA6_PETAA|nr:hypothetical protein BDV23DRAFT_146898 [Aspergillus alliaceus]